MAADTLEARLNGKADGWTLNRTDRLHWTAACDADPSRTVDYSFNPIRGGALYYPTPAKPDSLRAFKTANTLAEPVVAWHSTTDDGNLYLLSEDGTAYETTAKPFDSQTPSSTTLSAGRRFVALMSGFYLDVDGRLWYAGAASHGEVGAADWTSTGANASKPVSGDHVWRAVGKLPNSHYTIGLDREGRLWKWGVDQYGGFVAPTILDDQTLWTAVGDGWAVDENGRLYMIQRATGADALAKTPVSNGGTRILNARMNIMVCTTNTGSKSCTTHVYAVDDENRLHDWVIGNGSATFTAKGVVAEHVTPESLDDTPAGGMLYTTDDDTVHGLGETTQWTPSTDGNPVTLWSGVGRAAFSARPSGLTILLLKDMSTPADPTDPSTCMPTTGAPWSDVIMPAVGVALALSGVAGGVLIGRRRRRAV